jgi:UDP-glucose:(heptosyl)LPS alpha-1,3-glucosyltransferase
LTEFGHEVTLIARERDSFCKEVNFIPIRYRARGSILKNYLFFLKVGQVLKTAEFDIVYGLSRVHPVDVFRVEDPLHIAWIESRYQHRLVRGLVSLSLRHRLLLSLERKLMFDPQVKILSMSKLVASQIEHYYGLPQSSPRLDVIYNGVDLGQFNPSVREAGKELRDRLGLQSRMVFVFVGGDARRKGLDTLIRALSSLRNSEYSLLVVGLTRERVPFYIPPSVEERLKFVGWVNRPEVYCAAADLLVLPTRSDPFGNVCLEAMACGTPVLTTAAAGASEIIEPGQTGFVMKDPQSYEGLRKKLEEYIGLTESEKKLMGEQAAHQAAQYTWERHGKALIKVFERIVR